MSGYNYQGETNSRKRWETNKKRMQLNKTKKIMTRLLCLSSSGAKPTYASIYIDIFPSACPPDPPPPFLIKSSHFQSEGHCGCTSAWS